MAERLNAAQLYSPSRGLRSRAAATASSRKARSRVNVA
jgi:hypothetical protein